MRSGDWRPAEWRSVGARYLLLGCYTIYRYEILVGEEEWSINGISLNKQKITDTYKMKYGVVGEFLITLRMDLDRQNHDALGAKDEIVLLIFFVFIFVSDDV